MRDKGDELKVAEAAGSPLTLVAWIRAAVDLYFTSKAVPLLDYNESRRVP
jgi:hypothetical protein